jgi:hypothetical protein
MSAGSGLGPATLGYTGFGTAWFDYDNDGRLDLLMVNGAIEAIKGRTNQPFPYDEKKLLFRNVGNGKFEDVSSQAGAVFKLSEVGRGAAFGDVDNDGRIDVLLANLNGPVRLLMNNLRNANHWIGLRLAAPRRGRGDGREDLVGARVEIVRRTGPSLWRRARADGSYASANDPRILAGLGESADPPRVRVRWPSGKTEEWGSVPVDRWTTLREGESRTGADPRR